MFGRLAIQEIAGGWADRWLEAEEISDGDEAAVEAALRVFRQEFAAGDD